jgi:hypothetical protein
MTTLPIAVVLADIAPQKRHDVAKLLQEELAKKTAGSVCVVPVSAGNGSTQDIVREILAALAARGMIAAAAEAPVYSADEEEKIRKRLEDLGYL